MKRRNLKENESQKRESKRRPLNSREEPKEERLLETSPREKVVRLGISMGIGLVLGCILGLVLTTFQGTQSGDTKTAYEYNDESPDSLLEESGSPSDEEETAAAEDEQEETRTATLLAVGDNLIHSRIYKSGLQDDGSYDFTHLYENIAEDVAAADLAIVNQETIFTYDRDDYSGYPTFAGPVEIGDALVAAGFDIVTCATNHTMDRGTSGVETMLDYWSTTHPETIVLGIHESEEDADTITTVECNGITFALLNYTYGLNGFTLPEGQEYLIDLLDEETLIEDIAKAKEVSDVLVVFLHCGTEYVYEPDDSAKEWVEICLENGVDIAINSHPHVLEPYALLTGEDGHQMLCYYSMGNLISTQTTFDRMIGGMAEITIEVTGEGEDAQISFTEYSLEPLVTHYNKTTGVYTVYKFSDYTDELAAQHQLSGTDGVTFSRAVIWNLLDEILSTEFTQPGAASMEQPWLELEFSMPDVGVDVSDWIKQVS